MTDTDKTASDTSDTETQGEQDWASLKKQLVAEGRTELVDALEDLMQEGRRIEAAKVMAELKSSNT